MSAIMGYELHKSKVLELTFVEGFRLDWLSGILLIVGSVLFLVAGGFSLYYIEKERLAQYSTLYFGLQLGLELVFMSTHFFSLFIFWELMVVSGYILVVFEKEAQSFEAGFKYLIISSVGSISILFGIGILSGLVPSLYFDQIIAHPPPSTALTTIALIFLVLGFGVTGGMIAFNQWLPDAHPAAPAPISALLSGIIVKAGIYGIYRSVSLLVPGIDVSDSGAKIILILAILTMTEGNLMVFAQLQRTDQIDLKRILAYSTTTHLGYLLMTTVLTSDLGKLSLIMHVINHAVAKSLLFLISGYIIHEYGTKDILKLRKLGIGQRDKVLGVLLFIPLMSLGGLPLTGGFVSKLMILTSVYQEAGVVTQESGFLFWILFFAIMNSALAFGGYLWLIKELIFTNPEEEVESVHTKNRLVKPLFSVLAVIIILLGIIPFSVISPINSIL
jgi:multicomponent Na+:H+ antiporter subunit D